MDIIYVVWLYRFVKIKYNLLNSTTDNLNSSPHHLQHVVLYLKGESKAHSLKLV